MKTYYGIVDTIWGPFAIACSEHAVLKAGFFALPSDFECRETTPLLLEAEQQLGDYLAGKRKQFELPLMPEGTLFQKRYGRHWKIFRLAKSDLTDKSPK